MKRKAPVIKKQFYDVKKYMDLNKLECSLL